MQFEFLVDWDLEKDKWVRFFVLGWRDCNQIFKVFYMVLVMYNVFNGMIGFMKRYKIEQNLVDIFLCFMCGEFVYISICWENKGWYECNRGFIRGLWVSDLDVGNYFMVVLVEVCKKVGEFIII